MKTLETIGTPWAELYRGSGRLTGKLAADPTRISTGEVAPGWCWVGNMTRFEFDREFAREEHGACHTANRPGTLCQWCKAAKWSR